MAFTVALRAMEASEAISSRCNSGKTVSRKPRYRSRSMQADGSIKKHKMSPPDFIDNKKNVKEECWLRERQQKLTPKSW